MASIYFGTRLTPASGPLSLRRTWSAQISSALPAASLVALSKRKTEARFEVKTIWMWSPYFQGYQIYCNSILSKEATDDDIAAEISTTAIDGVNDGYDNPVYGLYPKPYRLRNILLSD